MTPKRLVVIGASAGGIEALRSLFVGIPETFPAAICVVLHTSPESPGVLAEILDRVAPLPVTQAYDGMRLEGGRIYVAPPDRHLLVEPGRIRVTKGPREHRFRPAIDPLFRSAAQVFGPSAIGIVLSGSLDDGTAGLWTIKKLGGATIVQDPSEAVYSSMPLHALDHVQVDHVLPVSHMAARLIELTSEEPPVHEPVAMPQHIDVEVKIAKEENPRDTGWEGVGKPSPYACPDCHGVLLELDEDGRIRYRCHIGHAFSIDSLLGTMGRVVEDSISVAQRSLEEASILMGDLGIQLKEHDRLDEATRILEAAARAKEQAETLRQLVLEPTPVSTTD